MPVIPLSYPLDLTATAATNFIQNEVVTFNTAQEKMFVPSKGPFYTTTLEIRHGVTNALLQPETQYKLLQPVKEAIRMSGKEVCAVIYITDNSVPSITISYRVIGGVFSDTASEIGDILLNNPLPPSGQVSWWDILDKPDQFTPSEHLHHVDNIYGMSDVVAVLENMRIAILAGDSVAISAIYQYIHVLLTNLNYATMDDVMDLMGPTATQFVRTYKTYADLRDVSSLINNESYIYIATGKHAVNDRKAKIFMWDNTCTINDDDEDIIRPNHISVGIPGRFVSVLIIESKFKLLAASLGRAFDTEGNLLSSFNSTGRIFEGDLNTLVEQGPWLFTAASTNKPARMTNLSNDPMAIGEGYIIVTKLDGKVIQEVLMAGLDVSPNGEFIAQSFKRAGLETAPGDGTYTWSRWDATASQNTLARYGIEANIAGYNPVGSTHPDTIINAGKYWFSSATPDMPFQNGIMDVEVITLSSGVPGEVVQTIRWEGRLMNRNRYQVGPTTWYWSEWQVINGYDLQTENRMYDGGNLDSRLTPGVYYYHVNNINRPTDYGLLTVERETPDIVYQRAHSSDNRLFSRYRNASGVWTEWREYADALALSTVRKPWYHVANIAGGNYFDFILPPYKTLRVCLVGGGGEGGLQSGGGYEVIGNHGQDSFLSSQDESTKYVLAQGGRRGQGGYYLYQGGAPGADGNLYIDRGFYSNISLYPCTMDTAPAVVPSTAGQGGTGAAPIANHNGGGRGGDGKIITAEFSNVGGAPFAMRVRAGNQVGVNGGDGHTIGNAGYAVLYIEP